MCSQSYVMSNDGNPNACMVRKFKGREHREVSSFVELVMGDDFKITPGNSIYSMGVCMYLLANLHWPWPVRGKLCKDTHDCLALRDTVFRSNYTASDPTATISAASINYIIDLILANTKDLIDVKPCDVINIHQIRSEMAAEETGCNVKGVVYNRGQLMYQINQIKPCQLRADDTMLIYAESSKIHLSKMNRYRIIHHIGSGSNGSVHKAEVKATKEVVALKKIDITNRTGSLLEYILSEGTMMKHLNRDRHHPNVARYIDSFQYKSGKKKYFVIISDFIDGVDLDTYIEKHKNFPIDRVWEWMRQLASGVASCMKTMWFIVISSPTTSWLIRS